MIEKQKNRRLLECGEKVLKNCASPPELTESQLLKFLDDEADPKVRLHLDECEYCAERASELAHLQDQISGLVHPSSLELGEYHLRMMPDRKASVIEQHLRICPQCRREVEQLHEFLGDLAPVSESDLLGKAKVLIARLIGPGPGERGFAPAAVPLRGETSGPFIFEADGVVITLDVQADATGKASIQGQVAADEQEQWIGAAVHLLQDDMSTLEAIVDDLGAFGFEQIHPGSAQLQITSPEGIEVQIPNINIAL
jgi:hypothetical protein